MTDIVLQLVNYGVAGIVAVLAILALVRKDRQVQALYERLETKSDKMNRKYYALATELNETVKALMEQMGLDEVEVEGDT